MKQLIITLFNLIILLSLHNCGLESNSQKINSKPNILLILTDDMGYGDVEVSGNTQIRTPALDKLAENSVRFNYFYVSPVCAPTRASLLTGRYHQRTGVRSVTNGYETMDPNETTLAEILKSKGYRTGIFGKWHLGEYYPSVPNAQGFDEYLGFRTGHTNHYFDPTLEHNGHQVKLSGHITDILTNKALEFMTRESNQPFFSYLAYNAPHTPLQIDSTWWAGYSETGLAEREARIYGMIEQIDTRVGDIINTLDSANILDNTIVVFMSDNGPINGWQVPKENMRYNAGLRDQKFTIYEGGIRTQCYWMWKNHWEPGVVDQVAAHIDVLPTLLDILGLAPANNNIDGISLKPVFSSHQEALDRVFFQKYALQTLREPAPFPGGIARNGPWKMVNGTELYNVVNDVGEEVNLAEMHPEILEDLIQAYEHWYTDISDDRNLKKVGISVGHSQENPIYLQPHHGIAEGNVEFWGHRGLTGKRRGTHPSGVDSDWTANWKSYGDAISWKVDVVQSGDYSFKIIARDSSNREPVDMRLSINETSIDKSIITNSLSANWNEIDLGITSLEAGQCSFKLSLRMELDSNFEIRALVVEKH